VQSIRRTEVNGLPGFLMVDADGEAETLALAMHGDHIAAIYAVRNPDKLAYLARLS
jgi:RNA polymerase sigma-70 factor (ECF subfamily)